MPKYHPIQGHFSLHGILAHRAGSPNIYLVGIYDGKQKVLSCFTDNIQVAEKIAKDREIDLFKASPTYRPSTVGEVGDEVYEIHEKQWAPGTAANNKVMWEKWLKPRFGHLPIDGFREIHWSRFVDDFYKKKPNGKLFNKRKFMGKILRFAKKKGWIKEEFGLPIRDGAPREGLVLTDFQIETVIECGRVYDGKITPFKTADRKNAFKLAVYLGAYMGMRKDEILGLKKSEVNLITKTIHLTKPDTKTKRHTRDMGIAPQVLPVLVEHMNSVEGEYVFPALRGVAGRRRDLHLTWDRACERASLGYVREGGVKVNPDPLLATANFHDLRHTFITTKIHVEKCPIQDVADYVGNSVAIIDEVYCHATAEHTRHVVSGGVRVVK